MNRVNIHMDSPIPFKPSRFLKSICTLATPNPCHQKKPLLFLTSSNLDAKSARENNILQNKLSMPIGYGYVI